MHNPNGNPVLTKVSLSNRDDPNHAHDVGWRIESTGDWSDEVFGCNGSCPPTQTVLAYAPREETDVYKQLVLNRAFVNNALQSNEGPSFVSHQYDLAGQSGGLPGALTSPDAEAENPQTTPGAYPTGNYQETNSDADMMTGGCNANGQFFIQTVNMALPAPSPSASPYDNGAPATPCEEYNTLPDETLQVFGTPPLLDWQYIAHSVNSIWAAPMGVQHLYNQYTGGNPAIESFAVDPDAENFVLNIEGSTSPSPNPVRPFAALTYITPCEHESDHPQMSGTDDGPAWLAWVINAIGNSPYWNTTTIIVTWNDWGGWYDHQPFFSHNNLPFRPSDNGYGNPLDPNEWGFRVPIIVISPYIRARGFISSFGSSGFQFRSQGAILQYIEATFGLASLKGDDLQNGHGDGLSDIFDYSRSPLPYVTIKPTSPFTPPPNNVCPNDP